MHFVLVHSPLVGAETWLPVGAALLARGLSVTIPRLHDSGSPPYWPQHVAAIQQALHDQTMPVVFVAHSGAGPFLNAVSSLGAPAGYLFADAGLPGTGESRLALMADEDAAFAQALETALQAGAHFPPWTDHDLRDQIIDPAARAQVLAGLRPRGLDYFTEPLPSGLAWPDAPCGYLQFSPSYAAHASVARTRGWPVLVLEGSHFHLLNAPEATAEALWRLSAGWTSG